MSSKGTKKKAILTEVILDRRIGDHLSELSELAFVAGYEVVDRITQKTDRLNPNYLFGKGKAKEIKGRIKELKADVVIIENQLDIFQLDNLRKMWHVEIIDRFELILEIFIKKAGTQEALTQIRLAALKKVVGSRIESHRSVTSRNALIKKLENKLEFYKSVLMFIIFFIILLLAILIPITLTDIYYRSNNIVINDIVKLVLLCLILIILLIGIISVYRYNRRHK